MTGKPASAPPAALLPCPFCGGGAERIDFGPGDVENAGGSCIACTQCQASGPVEFGRKENFVSNWNRRPQQPAGGEAVSAYGRRVGLQEHVRDVIRAHGGTREAGRAIKVDAAYLTRLASGEKDNPSIATLRKLGLSRKVIYVHGGKP